MERSKAEGKRRSKEDDDDQEDQDEEEEEDGGGTHETDSKMKRSGRRGSSSSSGNEAAAALVSRCQVENCGADLSDAKKYHRRHKVCEFHAKASFVRIAALPQRFCQQCSRFHDLSEFDDSKRSCRRRLAGHNERRRKSSAE